MAAILPSRLPDPVRERPVTRREQFAERDEKIYRYRENGWALADIADLFKISASRACSIHKRERAKRGGER